MNSCKHILNLFKNRNYSLSVLLGQEGERPTSSKWAENHGKEGVKKYWAEKNRFSLNGNETRILGKRT